MLLLLRHWRALNSCCRWQTYRGRDTEGLGTDKDRRSAKSSSRLPNHTWWSQRSERRQQLCLLFGRQRRLVRDSSEALTTSRAAIEFYIFPASVHMYTSNYCSCAQNLGVMRPGLTDCNRGQDQNVAPVAAATKTHRTPPQLHAKSSSTRVFGMVWLQTLRNRARGQGQHRVELWSGLGIARRRSRGRLVTNPLSAH